MTNKTYSATPLGIMMTVIPESLAEKASDALWLHMQKHYGPLPGIVIDEGKMFFVRLGKDESK